MKKAKKIVYHEMFFVSLFSFNVIIITISCCFSVAENCVRGSARSWVLTSPCQPPSSPLWAGVARTGTDSGAKGPPVPMVMPPQAGKVKVVAVDRVRW